MKYLSLLFFLFLSHIINDCKLFFNVQNTKICSPNVIGLKNVIHDKIYDKLISDLTLEGHEMVGFYVNDENQDKHTDDVVALYINSEMKRDYDLDNFKKICLNMRNFLESSIYHNLTQTKSVVELMRKVDSGIIKVDKTILIESYSINQRSFTFTTLGKRILEKGEIYTITTINLLLIKNKIIIMNYDIKYSNHNSLNELRKKNDYFVQRILVEN